MTNVLEKASFSPSGKRVHISRGEAAAFNFSVLKVNDTDSHLLKQALVWEQL